MQRSSVPHKTTTQHSLVHQRRQLEYVHNITKITISLVEHDFLIIFYSGSLYRLVQHIKMCTGSLKGGGGGGGTTVNTTRWSEAFKYTTEIEAVKNNIFRIHLYNYVHIHKG